MIRVSQGKQYFIVAFAAAPFELWDLRKLCLSAASNQLTQDDIERRISELHKLHKVC